MAGRKGGYHSTRMTRVQPTMAGPQRVTSSISLVWTHERSGTPSLYTTYVGLFPALQAKISEMIRARIEDDG